MKLTTIILLISLMQVSAASFGQKLNLVDNSVSIEKVLREIKKQTNYNVLVESTNFNTSTKIRANFINTPLEKVMESILNNTDMVYTLENHNIVIKPKEKSYFEGLIDRFLSIDVTGKVVDSLTGRPLPGANIMVKGSKSGTRSTTDGSFKLGNVDENATLLISYIGYGVKEVKAAKNLGTIKLSEAAGKLQEVAVTVNTGYQRIKPEQSTGAVSQLSTKEYEARITTNFLDGLVNKLPGLMINGDVNFTSTTPGTTGSNSRPLFNIRGISTMSANQSPLIVIDGYPTTLTIDMIDPNEIKSVTILKDAAAATVYGVRASNGVIVIERKQAAIGQARFNFNTTFGFKPKEDYSRYRYDKNASSIVTNYFRTTQSAIVNPSSWAALSSSAAGSIGRQAPYYIAAQAAAGMITPAQAESAYADLASYDNINDYSDLFERTASTQSYNLNISGGNENALYYITTNYTGNRNTQVLNDNDRLSLSARTTIKLSKKLALELTTDYNQQHFNNASVPGPTTYNSFERFRDVNGKPTSIIYSSIAPSFNTYIMSQGLEDDAVYPLIDMNEISNKSRTTNNRITANFKYDLGKGFDLMFGGIYETSNTEFKYLATERSSLVKQYINDYVTKQTDGTLKYNIPKGGYLRQQNANTSSYTARAQLNYNKTIGNHTFNTILGTEVRSLVDRSNLTTSFGYNDETLLQQGVDYGSIVSNAAAIRTGNFGLGNSLINRIDDLFKQQYQEDRFLSAYSNLVYSFKSKYSASGSIRIDQSNLFGTNPKYKYKPIWSVGAAWNIHKENFIQDINWIKFLKLRVAYGFNGNVAKLSLPEVIAQARFNTNTSPVVPSLRLVSYANSSLRWEQTQNLNAGLDFSIFKSITGSIDAYTKKSTDLLGNSLIDPTLGVSPTLINQATIRNNGIEFGLHADWISTSKFNWNTGIVVAKNSSKVLDVFRRGDFNPQTLNALGYVKGYPTGAMFAYNTVGLNNMGYPILADPNGNIIQTNNNSFGSPQTAAMASETSGLVLYAGSSIPTINAGLSNRFDFGNFYFYAMVNYYGGFKVAVPRPNINSTRPLEGAGNYWKAPGDELNTDQQALAAYTSANSNNAYTYAASYVVDGDYLTIGDLTLSYSLDKLNFLKKAGFRKFEIKAQASNVYTVGFNRYNYSRATQNFAKTYITPTYTLGLFTNF